jgi:uncharacterized membrane protein YhaH (DUF805 family)
VVFGFNEKSSIAGIFLIGLLKATHAKNDLGASQEEDLSNLVNEEMICLNHNTLLADPIFCKIKGGYNMNWYLEVIKKYAVFSGRARRKEFWMFFLFNMIISFVLSFIGVILHVVTISNFYSLAVLIPFIAVGVRRMHDTNHSGWWILFPIVNLVFLVQDSQRGDNQFGPNPKGEKTFPRPVLQSTVQQPASRPIDETPMSGKIVTIPTITQDHLSVSLVESSRLGDAGPGGSSFQGAIQNMNSKNDAAATQCFKEALRQGLDPLRQGYAHANLGTILLKKRDLNGAVEEFFQVLASKEALYESVHTAAQYLNVIMTELGRQKEAVALQQLAGKTSAKLGYSLSPSAAEEVRNLVRASSIKAPTPAASVESVSRTTTVQKNKTIDIIIIEKKLRPLGNKKRLGENGSDYRAQFRDKGSAERYYDAFVKYAESNPPPILIEVMAAYTPNTIYAEKYSFILPYFNVGVREDYCNWAREAILNCNDVLRQHSYCAGNSYEYVPKSISSNGSVIKWTIILPNGCDPESADMRELLSDPPDMGFTPVNIEGQGSVAPEKPDPKGPWIGILFEISSFEEALYGRAATTLLFKIVEQQSLIGSVIHGGDIIPECRYWCSAVHTASLQHLERIEQAVKTSGDKHLAPMECRILKGSEVPVGTLPFQGFVNKDGTYVGN